MVTIKESFRSLMPKHSPTQPISLQKKLRKMTWRSLNWHFHWTPERMPRKTTHTHLLNLEGNIEQVISTIDKLKNEVMTQKDFELHSEYFRVYQKNYLKAIFKGNTSESWEDILIRAGKCVFRQFTDLHKKKPDKRKKKFAVSTTDRDKIIVSNSKFFWWLKKKLTVDQEEYGHFEFTSAERYQDALAQ